MREKTITLCLGFSFSTLVSVRPILPVPPAMATVTIFSLSGSLNKVENRSQVKCNEGGRIEGILCKLKLSLRPCMRTTENLPSYIPNQPTRHLVLCSAHNVEMTWGGAIGPGDARKTPSYTFLRLSARGFPDLDERALIRKWRQLAG